MIAVYSAVFGYLMQLVAKHQKDHQADSGHESGQAQLLADQEGVYYRFGGAALSAMLHLRYDQLKSGVHELKREAVKDEITILKAIQCTDKHMYQTTCSTETGDTYIFLLPATFLSSGM